MDAEDAILHHAGPGHSVVHRSEVLPKLRRVTPLALVVEAVDTAERSAFEASAQQGHAYL